MTAIRFVLVFVVVTLLGSPLRAQPSGSASTPAEETAATKPVDLVVWNRKIVTFRTYRGLVRPAERAANAAQRIEKLPEVSSDWDLTAAPVHTGGVNGIVISSHGEWLFGVLPGDVDSDSNETMESAAQAAIDRLRDVLEARADQRRLPLVLRGIGYAALATLLFWILGWVVLRARAAALARLRAVIDARRSRIAVKGIELGTQLIALVKLFLRLVAFATIAVCAYVWLTFVLVQFPYTAPWGQQLGDFLGRTLGALASGAVAALPGLFVVAVILVSTKLVARAVSELFLAIERGRLRLSWLEAETARATRRLVVVIIWAFAIIVAYPYVPGSNTEAFKGVTVLVGLMISLGSSGVINQLMSGFVIVYSRAVRPGENVKLNDIEGTVVEVGLLATTLKTRRQEEITIPNSVLVATTSVNYTRLGSEHGETIWTALTIGYDAPWRQVHSLLLLAADRTPALHKHPAPRVFQRALSDFYVEYQLVAHMDQGGSRAVVLSELHSRIQDAFNEHGVQIMSPHFEGQPVGKVFSPREQWFASPAHPTPDGVEADRSKA